MQWSTVSVLRYRLIDAWTCMLHKICLLEDSYYNRFEFLLWDLYQLCCDPWQLSFSGLQNFHSFSFKIQKLHCIDWVFIYSKLGEEHERTKESGECLKHLTQQAVVFQKKMNEIVKGEKVTSLAGLQVHVY